MNFRNEATDNLFKTILKLKTVDECYLFFEDLCTVKELRDMSMRYHAATLLFDKVNYDNVVKTAKLSTGTVSRVNTCIKYGNGGYKLAIERQREDD